MVAHALVSGFVQGVGYRQFVRDNALKLGITGWVKNTSDNRVEALFCGPEDKINQILALCRKGPFLSEVKDAMVNWEDIKETYKSFEIVH